MRVSEYVANDYSPTGVLEEAGLALAYASVVRKDQRHHLKANRAVELEEANSRLAAVGRKISALERASHFHPEKFERLPELHEAGDLVTRERRKLRKMQRVH